MRHTDFLIKAKILVRYDKVFDFVFSPAAYLKQSWSSQMEETDASEDRTGGQRCGLPTKRTLPSPAGEVRGLIVGTTCPIHLVTRVTL